LVSSDELVLISDTNKKLIEAGIQSDSTLIFEKQLQNGAWSFDHMKKEKPQQEKMDAHLQRMREKERLEDLRMGGMMGGMGRMGGMEGLRYRTEEDDIQLAIMLSMQDKAKKDDQDRIEAEKQKKIEDEKKQIQDFLKTQENKNNQKEERNIADVLEKFAIIINGRLRRRRCLQ